jgi:hypothetical protein
MDISELNKGWGYLPHDVTDLPQGTYIYLTEEGIQTQTVLFKPNWYAMTDTASGMRQRYSFDYIGLYEVEVDFVYQSGDSVVWRIK